MTKQKLSPIWLFIVVLAQASDLQLGGHVTNPPNEKDVIDFDVSWFYLLLQHRPSSQRIHHLATHTLRGDIHITLARRGEGGSLGC